MPLPQKYFLFVGNLKPHKNLQNILKSFDKLICQYEDVYLVIVGQNKNLNHFFDISEVLKNNKKLKDKIKLIDSASDQDLPILYQLSKALVFPSLYEGFGYPPLEAMASGTCSIVSDRASLPEICENSAYYVKPLDIDSIYKAMHDILTDDKLRDDLINKGVDRVKLFDKKISIEKHLSLIKEMINES